MSSMKGIEIAGYMVHYLYTRISGRSERAQLRCILVVFRLASVYVCLEFVFRRIGRYEFGRRSLVAVYMDNN